MVPLFLLSTWACGTSGRVLVKALDDGGGPMSNLEITALPVNPQALLDSLRAVASSPRPTFPELEREMASFERHALPESGAQDGAWEATRDSITAIADTLRSLNRGSVEYRHAYGRLRALYERLGQRGAARDREEQQAAQSDRELALRAARAADSLRNWEREAYAAFPELLTAAVAQTGREPQTGATDAAGRVEFVLPPGAWWLMARRPDPNNPFQEYAWRVACQVTSIVPVTVPFVEQIATRRWRH